MNALMKQIREKARYLDADIHRELTIEEAQKELAVWSKDKIEDEDLVINLSKLQKIVDEVGSKFPLKYHKDYSEYVGKLQRVRQAQIGEIMTEIREWYEKYWTEGRG